MTNLTARILNAGALNRQAVAAILSNPQVPIAIAAIATLVGSHGLPAMGRA